MRGVFSLPFDNLRRDIIPVRLIVQMPQSGKLRLEETKQTAHLGESVRGLLLGIVYSCHRRCNDNTLNSGAIITLLVPP